MKTLRTRLLPLLLFIFALVPRTTTGRFLTIDEAYHWFDRVDAFMTALHHRDYAATNLIGHPGVTTMWLGSIGAWLERALIAMGVLTGTDADLHRALVRLPIAIVTSLCLVIALPLLRRLLGPQIAWLAVLFWAGEPFIVAHSQLLHLDALLTSFMMISLLALLVAVTSGVVAEQPAIENCLRPSPRRGRGVGGEGKPWMIVLSALFSGLALLTKSPAVFLIPMTGLVLLVGSWRNGQRSLVGVIRDVTPIMVIWLVIAVAVWVSLWPAAWLNPLGMARGMFSQAQADGGSPHGWGNYFWGQAVSDPGPFFYPVAILLRLAPWTLIGLVVLVGLFAMHLRQDGWAWFRRLLVQPSGLALLILSCFVLLFGLMMSIPPKKFDRYILPMMPALDILAAAGIVHGLKLWAAWRSRNHAPLQTHSPLLRFRSPIESRARGEGIKWVLVVSVLAINITWFHPYELAYFNPLVGGAQFATWAIPVGWGEGYEQVAAYVASQPNGADRPIAALYEPALNPFAPAGAAPMDWAYQPGRVDYAVLYIDQIQRGFKPWLVTGLLGKATPVYTVKIHGIDYAYVYQIAQPIAQPREATFGDTIQLRGYDLDTTQIRSGGFITVTLEWEGLGTPPADYAMFVHVLAANGTRVGQADVPPGAPRWPTSRWGSGRYITTIQRVPVQPNAPPGMYHIAIGLYQPTNFQRLPLHAPAGSPDPGAGPDALQLATFVLQP